MPVSTLQVYLSCQLFSCQPIGESDVDSVYVSVPAALRRAMTSSREGGGETWREMNRLVEIKDHNLMECNGLELKELLSRLLTQLYKMRTGKAELFRSSGLSAIGTTAYLSETNMFAEKRISESWDLFLKGEILQDTKTLKSYRKADKMPLTLSLVRSIVPATTDCVIEFLLLGARDLKPHSFIRARSPSVQVMLEMGGNQQDVKKTTRAENGDNPTYAEIISLRVPLPNEGLEDLCPRLEVVVYDNRFKGVSKPLLGVIMINLVDYLPWIPNVKEERDRLNLPAHDVVESDENVAVRTSLDGAVTESEPEPESTPWDTVRQLSASVSAGELVDFDKNEDVFLSLGMNPGRSRRKRSKKKAYKISNGRGGGGRFTEQMLSVSERMDAEEGDAYDIESGNGPGDFEMSTRAAANPPQSSRQTQLGRAAGVESEDDEAPIWRRGRPMLSREMEKAESRIVSPFTSWELSRAGSKKEHSFGQLKGCLRITELPSSQNGGVLEKPTPWPLSAVRLQQKPVVVRVYVIEA